MRAMTLLTVIALLTAGLGAQKPTPTPQMDSRGLPLPFGVQPYFKPDYPLGSGPYKAIMSTENGLSGHVAYYPADLSQLGNKKMPVVIWGNGSCLYAGNRYRQFLTEIASHGYLVITGGPMGPVELEVGPQSNPIARAQGAAGAPPQQNAANSPGAPTERVTVPLLKAAIDWAAKQNADSASRFNTKLDLNRIVVMGHSCGGGSRSTPAEDDSRVTGVGSGLAAPGWLARGNACGVAPEDQGPILLITGDERHDIAFGSGKSTFRGDPRYADFLRMAERPSAHRHVRRRNGGDNGVIARNWLEWTTRNDQNAGRMFKGAGCTLC